MSVPFLVKEELLTSWGKLSEDIYQGIPQMQYRNHGKDLTVHTVNGSNSKISKKIEK